MFCLFLLQVLDVTFTKRESDAMFTVQICTHVDCSVIQSHFHCSDLLACSSSTVHIAFRFHCSHLMSRTLPTLILCRLHCSAVMLQTLFFFFQSYISHVHCSCRFHCSHLMSRTLPTFVSPSLFSRHATDTFFFSLTYVTCTVHVAFTVHVLCQAYLTVYTIMSRAEYNSLQICVSLSRSLFVTRPRWQARHCWWARW